MPWDMTDYPVSMKNLPYLVRKKAIDIGNALLAQSYPEDRAIPIAISQAKEWYENATNQEKITFKHEVNPQKNDSHDKNKGGAKLIDADEVVKHNQDGWAVVADDAKRASGIYATKQEALQRARKIARHKGSKVKIYGKDGSLQDTVKPRIN